MSHRSEDKRIALEALTGNTGHVSALELEWLLSAGATALNINEAWMEIFIAGGATSLAWNDAASEFLTTLGFTGTVSEQWDAYWKAGGGTGSGGSFAADTDGNLAAGLLFYSHQEDGVDASGNNSDAVVTDVTYQTGIIGNEAVYDGVSGDMNFGDILDVVGTEARTFSFWLTTNNSGVTPILSKGGEVDHTGIGMSIFKAGVANVYFYMKAAGGTGADHLQCNCDTGVGYGVRHHIIITYDGSQLISGVKFWVNNVTKAAAPTFDTLSSTIANASDFLIGSDNVPTFGAYEIDELGIFDYVFSSNDRADMYGAGAANVFTP